MSQPPKPLAPVDLERWLRSTVLPFWASTGFDSGPGAFVEKLDLSGEASSEDYTRVRLQARQIYVFAHAQILGLFPDGLALASRAFAFLSRHGWDQRSGGWFHQLRRDGHPLDRTKDCYDHAFVLLALAWLYRAGGDPAVLAKAQETMKFLDTALRLERSGNFDGYAERVVASGEALALPRRQNPHMHLLEAFLALYEASKDADWLARAREILGLFARHFFAAETGQLTEFFDQDWQEVPLAGKRIREPGHHFEWVWLLHRYGQLSGDHSFEPAMEPLFAWAWKHGIDRRDGGVFGAYDEVDETGGILKDGSKRLWPQTEALKACLALTERGDHPQAGDGIEALLQSMFAHFVSLDHGLWQDQLSGSGRMIAPAIPASSLYHLFLAIVEAIRVLPAGR